MMSKKVPPQEEEKLVESAGGVAFLSESEGPIELEEALERLHRSREEEREEARGAGYQEGRAWATIAAPWTELDYLASDKIEGCNEERDAWIGLLEELPSLGDFIENDYREEWKLLAHALPSEFAAGFQEAAFQIWKAALAPKQSGGQGT